MSSTQNKKTPYLLFSTVSNLKEANKIASALIKKKLAACVNVIPNLKSYFRWQGKLDRADEVLLIIKTEKPRLKIIESEIRKLHSYSVPEIIGWKIEWGSKSYLDWLSNSVS